MHNGQEKYKCINFENVGERLAKNLRKSRRTIKIGEQLANFAKGSRKKRRAEKSENVENAGERESEKIRGRALPPGSISTHCRVDISLHAFTNVTLSCIVRSDYRHRI